VPVPVVYFTIGISLSSDEDFSDLWNHSHDIWGDAQPLEYGKLHFLSLSMKALSF